MTVRKSQVMIGSKVSWGKTQEQPSPMSSSEFRTVEIDLVYEIVIPTYSGFPAFYFRVPRLYVSSHINVHRGLQKVGGVRIPICSRVRVHDRLTLI